VPGKNCRISCTVVRCDADMCVSSGQTWRPGCSSATPPAGGPGSCASTASSATIQS
jgi:hypothetical protein